jgi:hypothetical protein
MVLVSPEASCSIESVATLTPLDTGVKRTLMLQLAPAAIELPQSLTCEN